MVYGNSGYVAHRDVTTEGVEPGEDLRGGVNVSELQLYCSTPTMYINSCSLLCC